jgi:hypothetical protein
MLNLQNVTISIQSFGTVLGVFLTGKDRTAIEQRFFSFWNHGATKGEMEWWSDTCAFFWVTESKNQTAEEKFKLSLIRAALYEILPPTSRRAYKHVNAWVDACEIGLKRFELIDRVNWLVFSNTIELFSLADSISAEKETGNFDDDVLGSVVSRDGATKLEMLKIHVSDNEHEPSETPENASEDVQLAGLNAVSGS